MKALAIAAGIVFWTLVLGVALLMFLPGSNSGEPVAIVQIDQAPPAAPPAPPAGPAAVDLPPGFSVTGPSVSPAAPPPGPPGLAPPGQGTTMMPVTPGQLLAPPPPPGPNGALPQGPERHGAARQSDLTQVAAGAHPAPQQAAADLTADLTAGIDQTGPVPLPPVPVTALVEESPYGPLPKIAADGRRPAEVYARPSRYAHLPGGPPRVAVLVNGLGVPGAADGDVIKGLPPPVSLAYGAYGRSVQDSVSQAREQGHEILLAIPLEPNDYPAEDPGPHTLLTTLPTEDNLKRLHWLMSRYAGYAGVTNHMGAKFKTAEASLEPVLAEVKRRGLIFIDDGSVEGSAAGSIAKGLGLDYAVVHVRLDADKSAVEIAKALAELEDAAKAQGAAIGVAKAEPATVKQIADWVGSLEAKGLVLVPVTAAMRSQRQS